MPSATSLVGERLERGRVERRIALTDRRTSAVREHRVTAADEVHVAGYHAADRRCRRLELGAESEVGSEHVERDRGDEQLLVAGRDHRACRHPPRRRPCRRRRSARTTRRPPASSSVAFWAASGCLRSLRSAAAPRRVASGGAGTTAGRSSAAATLGAARSSSWSWSPAAPPRRRTARDRRARRPARQPARSARRSVPLYDPASDLTAVRAPRGWRPRGTMSGHVDELGPDRAVLALVGDRCRR